MRTIQLIDSRAWRASQGAPFQFARWLAALATVLIDWVQSGTPQSAVAYLPVLTVVALMLLPDAESIGVGSLRFERLTSEVGRQEQGARPEHKLQTVQMAEQNVTRRGGAPVAGQGVCTSCWADAAGQSLLPHEL